MINRYGVASGLFGRAGGGSKIINIGLLNVDVVGYDKVGSLVGGSSGSITNSYATGSVTGTEGTVGGLVGYNQYGGSITNSYATCSVIGTGDLISVGGLAGENAHGGATITNSFATGSVKGSGDSSPHVGGLVGLNFSASITNSYATGSAMAVAGYGGSFRVGGLVGSNYKAPITNSYATGSVSGTGIYLYIGGLVGINYQAPITNSYATGSVSGTGAYPNIGGLVGVDYSSSIRKSYWDKTTSGITTSDGGTAKTTTQLQEPTEATGIYSSWSANMWDFGTTKQYPALKYRDGTMMPNQGREPSENVLQMPQ